VSGTTADNHKNIIASELQTHPQSIGWLAQNIYKQCCHLAPKVVAHTPLAVLFRYSLKPCPIHPILGVFSIVCHARDSLAYKFDFDSYFIFAENQSKSMLSTCRMSEGVRQGLRNVEWMCAKMPRRLDLFRRCVEWLRMDI
jgi:hypothetical protein